MDAVRLKQGGAAMVLKAMAGFGCGVFVSLLIFGKEGIGIVFDKVVFGVAGACLVLFFNRLKKELEDGH
jgi:hypothetical protein